LSSKPVLKLMNNNIQGDVNDIPLQKRHSKTISMPKSKTVVIFLITQTQPGFFLNNKTSKFNLELYKLKENKVQINSKETIENFNLNLTRTLFYLESEEKKQEMRFEEMRKKKLHEKGDFGVFLT
jgi:hypothetical protein